MTRTLLMSLGLNDVYDQLLQLESSQDSHGPIATHILALMVRGYSMICSSLLLIFQLKMLLENIFFLSCGRQLRD